MRTVEIVSGKVYTGKDGSCRRVVEVDKNAGVVEYEDLAAFDFMPWYEKIENFALWAAPTGTPTESECE